MVLLGWANVKMHILQTALIACVLLSGCTVVPPVGNESRPMTAADTSWRVREGL